MRKIIILFLLFAPPVEAGPLDWMKHHPKTMKLLAAGAAAGVHAYGLHHCRLGGVENCDGKYGASWGIFGAVTAANFVMIPVSEKLGGRQGDIMSYGGSAVQLGHGIVQWRKEPHAETDLRSFIRH